MNFSSDRLDQLLVARGLFETRARARDAIQRGTVLVNGIIAKKPGATVSLVADIVVEDRGRDYVSRGALKLIAGLDHFKLDPAGRDCLDIGISTGGFCDVLLERGARHVIGVDVGHGQLHQRLATHERVTHLEGLNARLLDQSHLGGANIEFVVCDVSFISLTLALPPALRLASSGCLAILLVKPQFEAGREAIGKRGILKDPGRGQQIIGEMGEWLASQPGWKSLGTLPCPLTGSDGNQEYLLAGMKHEH